MHNKRQAEGTERGRGRREGGEKKYGREGEKVLCRLEKGREHRVGREVAEREMVEESDEGREGKREWRKERNRTTKKVTTSKDEAAHSPFSPLLFPSFTIVSKSNKHAGCVC